MKFPLVRCFVLTSSSAILSYHYVRSKSIEKQSSCTRSEAWYRSLPMREVSRFWSRIFSVNIYPESIRTPIYRYFARIFDADLDECEFGPDQLNHYKSFAEFFRRNLKPNVRPIDAQSFVVSPCDGQILDIGRVSSIDKLTMNVKGVPYAIKDLFQYTQKEIDDLRMKTVKSSLFYACIYLNPGNYHHFHSPAKWTVCQRRHITGELLSVRPEFIFWIRNLLLLNERVAYFGNYQHGWFSQTMVGATNVGSIDVYFDATLKTNNKSDDYTFRMWKENVVHDFEKGDAFGEFKMGSFIILMFEAPSDFQFVHERGQQIRVGQRI